MIEVKNVSKYYGRKSGVTDISFTIKKGEIVGLLGPNGSGKSTTLKMLTGYHMPTTGTIMVNGYDTIENPKQASACIGFMPENPPLYAEMEVYDFLMFAASIKGIGKKKSGDAVSKAMELTQITSVKNRLIKNLSKGYCQRVGLTQALLGMPEVIILDEPTAGLDPKQISGVRELLGRIRKDHTILLSSHILSEISMTCERVLILNNGHLAAADTIDNIRKRGAYEDRFIIKAGAEREEARRILYSVAGVTALEDVDKVVPETGKSWIAVVGENSDELKGRVSLALSENHIPILEMREHKQSLEEIFLQLTDNALIETEEKGA